MQLMDRELIQAFEAEMASVRKHVHFELPPLRREATYGVFPWWPEQGNDWIHPDDVKLANQLIPSDRIFRREDQPNGWSLLRYGRRSIRIRPTLWLQVNTDGYEVGDPVEVISKGGRETPLIATIAEIYWDRNKRQVIYRLDQNGTILPKQYRVDQFRMVKPIDRQMSLRQMQLLERNYLR